MKANKGAAGVDGLDIARTGEHLKHAWPDIRQQLSDGTYRPQPVRRAGIPKPDGGERELRRLGASRRVAQSVAALSRRWWHNSLSAVHHVPTRLPTSAGWECRVSHDLNFSNRPVRPRMPGGVAGERSALLAAPMPIGVPGEMKR